VKVIGVVVAAAAVPAVVAAAAAAGVVAVAVATVVVVKIQSVELGVVVAGSRRLVMERCCG
jgi:hypothetical protein